MAQTPGFDMRRMSTATKILLGASVIYLIDSFLPYWNRVCFGGGEVLGTPLPESCAGTGLWNGIGVLTGLLVLALAVWEGLRAFGVSLGNLPQRTVDMISVGLAAGVLLFTLIKVLVHSEALSWGAYLGIVLALVIGYGGYMRWQEAKVGGMGTTGTAPPPPPAPGSPPPTGGGGGFSS